MHLVLPMSLKILTKIYMALAMASTTCPVCSFKLSMSDNINRHQRKKRTQKNSDETNIKTLLVRYHLQHYPDIDQQTNYPTLKRPYHTLNQIHFVPKLPNLYVCSDISCRGCILLNRCLSKDLLQTFDTTSPVPHRITWCYGENNKPCKERYSSCMDYPTSKVWNHE